LFTQINPRACERLSGSLGSAVGFGKSIRDSYTLVPEAIYKERGEMDNGVGQEAK